MPRSAPLDPAIAAELDQLEALLAEEVRASAPRMDAAFAARLDEAARARTAPARDVLRDRSGERRRASRRPRAWLAIPAVALPAAVAVVVAIGLRAGPDGPSVTDLSAPAGGAPTTALGAPPSAPGAAGESGPVAEPSAAGATGAAAPTASSPAPARGRQVERGAALTLAAPADRLADVADGVIRVTDGVGGHVARSEVQSAGRSGYASFDLRVPAERLADALRGLSRLAHVRSRSEQTEDVTARFDAARARLADARAERRALLAALGRATTANQTASLRARLALVRSQLAAAAGDLAAVRRRARTARVAVTIEPARGAGSTPPPGAGDRWTPGDALRDAGRILGVVLGILIVGTAALAPPTLLAGLALLVAAALRRRRREAALDGPPGSV